MRRSCLDARNLIASESSSPFLDARVDNAALASPATSLDYRGAISAEVQGDELMWFLALPQLTRFSA